MTLKFSWNSQNNFERERGKLTKLDFKTYPKENSNQDNLALVKR